MLIPSAQLEVMSHFSEGRVYAGFCSNIKMSCLTIRKKEGFLRTTTVFNVLFCATEFLGDFYGTLLQRGFYPNFILVLVSCQTYKDGSTTNYLKWKECSSMVQNEDV